MILRYQKKSFAPISIPFILTLLQQISFFCNMLLADPYT